MTSQQIAKRIDLQRIKSIIDDEPKIEVKQPYNFDLPIIGDMTGKKIQEFLDNLTIRKDE